MGLVAEIGKALRASPKREPNLTSAAVAANQGRVGKGNVRMYRDWARGSTWVRGAINIRNNQIATAEWDVVPIDPNRRYSVRLQQQLRELFSRPNPVDKTFARWAMKVNEDLLTLDAGSIEKDRSLDGVVRQLHAVDGGEIKVNALWDGDPRESRYYWCPGGGEPKVSYLDRDLVYVMQNPISYLPVGVAPLETLKYVIDALLSGDAFNIRQVKSAAPDGMLDLGEGANDKQVDAFRSYWLAEVAGKGAMAFIGGTKGAKFTPFRSSNKDMQFLEWETFLVRQVAICFGLSPQDLGITFDVNRSQGEVLDQQTEDRGQRPLMGTLQEYFTEGIVHDEGFGGPDNNLAFRFKALSLKETKAKSDINEKSLAGAPWTLVDEARQESGRAPLGGKLGQMLLMKVANGVVSIDPNDIPTAREYLELMANKGGGAPAAGSPPIDGSEPPEAPES